MYKIIFSLIFLSVTAYGELTLEEIREAIKKKGALWTAGSTSVWELSPEERKHLCGLRIEPVPPDVPLYEPTKVTAYQESLDWRCRTYGSYTDADWTTTVKRQYCGDCWAFTTLAALESKMNIYIGKPDLTQNLSEMYLVSECFPAFDCTTGGSLYTTADFLESNGVVDEACDPYGYFGDHPPCDPCADWQQRIIKIENWGSVSNTVNSIKNALINGPVASSMVVYGDFHSYTGGIYEHVSGGNEGGHGVTIVGWSNSPVGHWICKNSWGTGWGVSGWFRIKWGDSNIGFSTIYIQAPQINHPKLSYVSGEVSEITGDFDGVINPNEQVDLVTTLENAPGYATASSVTGILGTTSPYATINDNTGVYPNIPGGSTGSNSSNKFRATFADTLIAVPFTLGVDANQGGSYPYSEELEFSLKVTLNQFGWPVGVGQVRSSPAIVDLDGDLQNEIIFGADDGKVYVKNTLGENKPGFPFQATGKIWGTLAVGDVNNNSELEIVVGSWEDTVYVINKNGTCLTRKSIGDRVLATPVLSDLDGNGDLEIIVGGYDGYLYVFHHDGTAYSGFPCLVSSGGKFYAGAAVGDIDGDAVKDIVVGCTDNKVYAISSNGIPLSGWPFSTGGIIRGAPSIVDSSEPKVVVGSGDNNLYVIDAGGNEIFNVPTGGQIKGSPSFVDLDNDGKVELVFSSTDGNIYVYDKDGLFPGWPQSTGSSIESEPCFADLDNNGYPEIVVTTTDGYLWVYTKDGSRIKHFPVQSEGSVLTSPAIEDIDSDGDLEIVFGSNAGVHIIDIKSQGNNNDYWNMYRRNLHRTGYYGGKFFEVAEKQVPLVYSLSHIWPNPLGGKVAQINYTLSKPSQVRLSIYNSVGQELTTLINESQHPGIKTAYWDTYDVPSGIYFYKLTANEFECTRKITILK